jgi:hypothetical protein
LLIACDTGLRDASPARQSLEIGTEDRFEEMGRYPKMRR